MSSSRNFRIIFDRAHLGEVVYSPRYRGYDGTYVFCNEQSYHDAGLILLTTSDFSFIQDDGDSFDFDKKEEEQEDFIKAYNLSKIEKKVMVDVSENGGFKTIEKIYEEIVKGLE